MVEDTGRASGAIPTTLEPADDDRDPEAGWVANRASSPPSGSEPVYSPNMRPTFL